MSSQQGGDAPDKEDGPSKMVSVSGKKRPASLSQTDPGQNKRAAPSGKKKVMENRGGSRADVLIPELNEDCLRVVFTYLDTKSRLRVQLVSKQWKRVGRMFEVLRLGDFLYSSLPVHGPTPAHSDLLPRRHNIRRTELLRVLQGTNGSLRRVDLTVPKDCEVDPTAYSDTAMAIMCGMSEERADNIIHLGFREVDREYPELKMDGSMNLAEKLEMIKELRSDTPWVLHLCPPPVLPWLHSLSVQECENLHAVCVSALMVEALPEMRELELEWRAEKMTKLRQRQFRAFGKHVWGEFFDSIPTMLSGLTLHVSGQCGFLEQLALRLMHGAGLPALHSLHLYIRTLTTPLDEPVKALNKIFENLKGQLYDFKLVSTSELPGLSCDWSEMSAVQKLHLELRSVKDQLVQVEDASRLTKLTDLFITNVDVEAQPGAAETSWTKPWLLSSLSELPAVETLTLSTWGLVALVQRKEQLPKSLRSLRFVGRASVLNMFQSPQHFEASLMEWMETFLKRRGHYWSHKLLEVCFHFPCSEPADQAFLHSMLCALETRLQTFYADRNRTIHAAQPTVYGAESGMGKVQVKWQWLLPSIRRFYVQLAREVERPGVDVSVYQKYREWEKWMSNIFNQSVFLGLSFH